MSDYFWFSDAQWARIEPHLPADVRGKERVDDRRVLSGIVYALKNGGRWADCPREVYGPKKTLYNRFVRWAERADRGAASLCLSRRDRDEANMGWRSSQCFPAGRHRRQRRRIVLDQIPNRKGHVAQNCRKGRRSYSLFVRKLQRPPESRMPAALGSKRAKFGFVRRLSLSDDGPHDGTDDHPVVEGQARGDPWSDCGLSGENRAGQARSRAHQCVDPAIYRS